MKKPVTFHLPKAGTNLFVFTIVGLALSAAVSVTPPNKLAGRWQTPKFSDGSVLMAIFRENGTFDGFVNGKAFVNGQYYVREDTLGMADASCGAGYYGTYRMNFFAKDSVRFTVIRDTCPGRREGTDGVAFGRVKPAKP